MRVKQTYFELFKCTDRCRASIVVVVNAKHQKNDKCQSEFHFNCIVILTGWFHDGCATFLYKTMASIFQKRKF